jgi:hypothetical protein
LNADCIVSDNNKRSPTRITMLAELENVWSNSTDLNARFDTYVQDYSGHKGALKSNLTKLFSKPLWENYLKVALFTRNLDSGNFAGVSAAVEKKIDLIKHQVFVSFRRLVGLSGVKDYGPCPLCLKDCNAVNPRATSHIIADAAYRAMITQFDPIMAHSMLCLEQGIPKPGMNGPSAVKWKMLCRQCEQFVCDAGEAKFTQLLKVVLPAVNESHIVPDAIWRYNFAATLLWRTMHVVEPFANYADVSAMFLLYDELNTGMRCARTSLAYNTPVLARYPSTVLHVSALNKEKSNGGADLNIFFGKFGCGYVNVQIWTFHFFGFFRPAHTLSCAEKEEVAPEAVWVIEDGAQRRTPQLIEHQEQTLMTARAVLRTTATDAEVQRCLVRCGLTMNTTTNMAQFKGQPAVHDLAGIVLILDHCVTVMYWPRSKLVRYHERFVQADKFFGAGYDLVFLESCFEECDNMLVTNFLAHCVDPEGVIKKWLARVNAPDVSIENVDIKD